MFSFIRSAFFPWVLIFFAVILMWAGHKNGVEYAALRDHGVKTMAQITELEWKAEKHGSRESGHFAHVEFTTDSGRSVQQKVSITEDLNDHLRARSIPWTMEVSYLPEDPSIIRDASRNDDSDAQKGVARYLLLAGIAVLVLRHFFVK